MEISNGICMDWMFKGATAMTHPLPQTKEEMIVSNYFLKVFCADQNQK